MQARLGVLSDARGLYPRLTARENIVYYGRLQGMAPDAANARAEALTQMFEMRVLLDRRTEGFSQGERMKTALARALVHDPANIVLDEPTNGLDVLATRSLRAALLRLRDEQGKCIVFSSHIMQEVERLCDQVVVVAGGRTVPAPTRESRSSSLILYRPRRAATRSTASWRRPKAACSASTAGRSRCSAIGPRSIAGRRTRIESPDHDELADRKVRIKQQFKIATFERYMCHQITLNFDTGTPVVSV